MKQLKKVYMHTNEIHIKLLYTYCIFNEYLHKIHVISSKVILYVS